MRNQTQTDLDRIWRPLLGAVLFAAVLFTFRADAAAQTSEDQHKGFLAYEQVEGSYNSLGNITELDSKVGYNFNRYLGVDAGLPVYFIQPLSSSSSSGAQSVNGMGNIYADLRLTFTNPIVNYASTLTGAAPTGDLKKGLSTGRTTFDWNNHFDRAFGRWTPFANLGIANTVSDTRFFRRPFSSLGLVGHFDAGAEYNFWQSLSLGASAYDILPSGQQKIFSKLVPRQSTVVAGAGGHGQVFQTASETVGSADLARDNGLSTWVDASPIPFLDLEVGYSRSIHFRLNTVSFGVGVNVGYLVRKARGE